MSPREIFQRYREERRGAPCGGFKLELLPHLTRYVAEIPGADGMVVFAELAPENPDAAIDEQIAHFENLGQNFEWKVHDFDPPSALKRLLAQRGFESADEEALLVLNTSRSTSPVRDVPGITIERIVDPQQLTDFVAAEEEIFSNNFPSHIEKYTRDLQGDPNGVAIYCAYAGEKPIGTGRVSFPAGSSFAELNSGGVVSRMRGRGVFTALLSRRIEEARSRGYEWVAVDAAPMSRPILLRKGFQHVCWTYPMLRPKAALGI
jgi:GNAT superfamily N-acetyltransferase